MSLSDYLAHPLFILLQRGGTCVWTAYFRSSTTGHACFGGGDTPQTAMRMALDAARGSLNEDLFA